MRLLLLFFTTICASVTDCSRGTSKFGIRSLSFGPDPMKRGQNSTIRASLSIPYLVRQATVTYSITYNYIPMPSFTEPLCNSTVMCPITPGVLEIQSSYPASGLYGSVQIKIVWKDTRLNELLCVFITTRA